MQSLLIALQFLTCVPVRLRELPTGERQGASLLMYPLVGGLIGLVLLLVYRFFGTTDPWLLSGLLLLVWVLLTGALHLDGLADSADAWLGGRGDRERTLAIMKDPCSGPAGVVAIVLVLLLKLLSLVVLVRHGMWLALWWIPVLGRGILLPLFLGTPYVRSEGLGSALASHLPRAPAYRVSGLLVLLVLWTLGMRGFWLILVLALLFVVLRRGMLQRIGGMTGDTAGALVEITEVACLLVLAVQPE